MSYFFFFFSCPVFSTVDLCTGIFTLHTAARNFTSFSQVGFKATIFDVFLYYVSLKIHKLLAMVSWNWHEPDLSVWKYRSMPKYFISLRYFGYDIFKINFRLTKQNKAPHLLFHIFLFKSIDLLKNIITIDDGVYNFQYSCWMRLLRHRDRLSGYH